MENNWRQSSSACDLCGQHRQAYLLEWEACCSRPLEATLSRTQKYRERVKRSILKPRKALECGLAFGKLHRAQHRLEQPSGAKNGEPSAWRDEVCWAVWGNLGRPQPRLDQPHVAKPGRRAPAELSPGGLSHAGGGVLAMC